MTSLFQERQHGLYSHQEITDLRTERPYPRPPFVTVEHKSCKGFGAIHLYQVNKGYIIEFYIYLFADDEENIVYIHEFSENPRFDFWQERYVEFLTKADVENESQ